MFQAKPLALLRCGDAVSALLRCGDAVSCLRRRKGPSVAKAAVQEGLAPWVPVPYRYCPSPLMSVRMAAAPQAVLEAYGGVMSKLPPFLVDQTLESYTHLKTATNLDFVPGMIRWPWRVCRVWLHYSDGHHERRPCVGSRSSNFGRAAARLGSRGS